jgi:hypothetical protein
MRELMQRRASRGGEGRGNEGGGLVISGANKAVSNTGTALHRRFQGWPSSLMGRFDIGVTVCAQGGRFDRLKRQKKESQVALAFGCCVLLPTLNLGGGGGCWRDSSEISWRTRATIQLLG